MPRLRNRTGSRERDPRTLPTNPKMKEYADLIEQVERHYKDQSLQLWKKSLDWWDLFLAIQADTRDPVDEQWRSDVFVPMPYITTRTKSAQTVELLANVEPIWQVEATRESGPWYEQSKHIERLLDYTHRMNAWRKFLYKLTVARSVQGTALMKVVWTRRAHSTTLYSGPEEIQRFESAIQAAVQGGAPRPPDWQADIFAFEHWRQMVNLAGRFGRIPAPPSNGPVEVEEYEGPLFQYLPLWSVRMDPLVDEIRDQKYLIHRMVKPISYITSRMDNDPNSAMPYYQDAVEYAREGNNGSYVLETEEQQLAEAMGLNPNRESHPLYQNRCEILEVWSPEENYKYAVLMNRRAVINKRPFEKPLLTSHPNVFALRNVVVPGFAYGLSDYQEPEKLFRELNSFRRIRMDGATLTTLPVFVKQAGVQLTEAIKKIKPGLILTLPTKDAITSLIKHTMPPEAYREPQEIKLEIEDATEVYGPQKGAPATIGRVTGTEFQGRSSNILLKYKVDASIVEDELLMLPPVILSFFAQLGQSRTRLEIGGDPDALVDVSREDLIASLGYRFRFRGATKNIQPDLQVQQLTTAVNNFRDALTIPERRFALQLIFELLDIRGYSKVLSNEGGMQLQQQEETARLAQSQQNKTAGDQAAASGVRVPGAVPAEAAAMMGGGGGGA